jgi:hypothetical protein
MGVNNRLSIVHSTKIDKFFERRNRPLAHMKTDKKIKIFGLSDVVFIK